ncbi:MAG: sigma-70 family RNA polymerase sigma factor [Clostridia bacterium]|nr:sigma-70 family RNA polymerase sigma factor [Clostridia bacterium]
MEDCMIVELYWQRCENAISETKLKYERLLTGISLSLSSTREDAEDCVSDTYLAAWNAMPSDRPTYLGAYLSKIVRRLSIDRLRTNSAQKRGGGSGVEELYEALSSLSDVEGEYDERITGESISRYVASLDEEKRYMFVRRYFYSDSIETIAFSLGVSVAKVKTTLFRTRTGLRRHLEREGVVV